MFLPVVPFVHRVSVSVPVPASVWLMHLVSSCEELTVNANSELPVSTNKE